MTGGSPLRVDRLCRPGLVARIEPRLCRVSPPSGFQRLPIAQVGEGRALCAWPTPRRSGFTPGIARRCAASSRPFGSPRSTLKTDPILTGCGDLIDGHRARSPSAAGCRVRPVGVGPVGLQPAQPVELRIPAQAWPVPRSLRSLRIFAGAKMKSSTSARGQVLSAWRVCSRLAAWHCVALAVVSRPVRWQAWHSRAYAA